MAGRGGSQSERRRERTPDRGRGSASHPPSRGGESPSPPPLPPKRHTYRRVASDQEEEEIVVVSENSRSPSPSPTSPPPLPPKKKPRKTKHVVLQDVSQDSEDERQAEEELAAVGFSYPPVRITEKDGKRSFETLDESDPLAAAASAKMMVKNPMSLPIVSAWEKGMEIMTMLMDRYRVETDLKANFQLMPEQGEVYRRICHLYINEEHRGIPLTFTSNKTLTTMMGRFLQGFVHAHSQIAHKNWECTGCALWLHGCTEAEGKLRCLHGTTMIQKEHMIEMDVASENGQRALKENPDRAKITQNRWGRSVVQLANNDARCCVHDAGCATNQFSSKSCGVFFTEGAKAQQAFRQLEAFMKAMYPGMNADQAQMMLIPLHCDCNHKPGCVPTMGRQTCKMTPFGMANAEDLDVESITDATVLASVKHPALMVFQCCNPVYRNSRAQNAGPNCDFKISAPDLLGALQLTRKLWTDSFPDTPLPKLLIPEFKWLAKYQFRNVSLPAGHAETRQNPFDF